MTVLILALFFAANARADFSQRDVGKFSGASLKRGMGARVMALGQAGSAAEAGAESIYYNPAQLGERPEKLFSFSHSFQMAGIKQDAAAIVMRLRGGWGFGFSANYFNFGGVDQADDAGVRVGSFQPADLCVSMGLARPWRRLRFGLVGKYVHSRIVRSDSTFSGDAGALFIEPRSRIRLAVVAQNLAGKLTYAEKSSSLPMVFRLGVAKALTERVSLVLEEVAPQDGKPYGAGGVEVAAGGPALPAVFLRAGYNQSSARNKESPAGLHMGMGIKGKSIAVDYGWAPLGDLGQEHLLSLTMATQ